MPLIYFVTAHDEYYPNGGFRDVQAITTHPTEAAAEYLYLQKTRDFAHLIVFNPESLAYWDVSGDYELANLVRYLEDCNA